LHGVAQRHPEESNDLKMSHKAYFPLLFSIVEKNHEVSWNTEAQKENGPNFLSIEKKPVTLYK
jgi:hypothetical protein